MERRQLQAHQVRWSRDGQELFYLSPEDVVMGVRVDTGPEWRSSIPTRILQGSYYFAVPGFGRNYDISLDGRRFLVIKQGAANDASARPNLMIVEHWGALIGFCVER